MNKETVQEMQKTVTEKKPSEVSEKTSSTMVKRMPRRVAKQCGLITKGFALTGPAAMTNPEA